MAVRLIGPYQVMGPVAVNTTATIVRNAIVRVVSGLVTAVTNGANTGLAVALDKYPDPDFVGHGTSAKTQVELAMLDESVEVEVPFSGGALTQAMIGGGPYELLATGGGTVNVAATSQGVFRPRRPGRDTKLGDTSGYLVGVFVDAAVSF